MKLGLVIGHNAQQKGAYSEYFGMNEFDFYSIVANLIKQQIYLDVFTRQKASTYKEEMSDVISSINGKGYDLIIEMHFNACDTEAHGCECLCWYDSIKGTEYSQKFIDFINANTGIKKRGIVKVDGIDDRGYYGIMKSDCPYILIEPFFGDNEDDCEKIGSTNNMAKLIIEYIRLLKGSFSN